MKLTSRPIGMILLTIVFLYSFKTGEDEGEKSNQTEPPFLSVATPWSDSVFNTLNEEERIAQLFMVAAYSNRDGEHEKALEKLISQHGIGGLIYFQGGPLRQANMCNRLQSKSDVPLLIGMDAEWGLAMRLDSTVKYPWQMTLGAIQDNQLIYEMGRQIGWQLKRMGVHVNFAPVVDINVNPENPVINARSFGEDKQNVAEKGIAYMLGLQSERVMANAKHFPGHGDTDKDSHKTLPIIDHKQERLDSVELYPFKELMKKGLSSVMVAHLFVPAYESEFNLAATLSSSIVSGLLKDSLNYSGLVVTDALNMKGVSSYYKPGEVDVKALLAGNDILLFSEDVPKAISEIQKAIKQGQISQEEVDKRCLKVLRAKEWVGLNNYQAIDTANLFQDLNQEKFLALKRKLTASSLTILSNKEDYLPIQSLDTLKIAAIALGNGPHKSFHRYLSMYTSIDTFSIPFEPEPQLHKKILDQVEKNDLLIISIHTSDRSPYNRTKITGNTAAFLSAMRMKKKVCLVSFANPYAMTSMNDLSYFDVVLQAYQNNESANELAAQLIFGGVGASGKIPVSVNGRIPAGTGLEIDEPIRMNYVLPEEIGLERNWLDEIDTIAIEGLVEGAYPGCQILAAYDGHVFYNRTFGYHTYDSNRQVKVSDVYDLASITKIASTLLMIMDLDQKGEIELDYALCDYLPDIVDTTPFANLSLREILAHQAGLPAWIPFYKKTVSKGHMRYDVYSLDSSKTYSRKVADRIWINGSYRDSIFNQILESELNEPGEYKYSDIGYYFLKEIVERKTGMKIEEAVDKKYYASLGMDRTRFNPKGIIPDEEIIPTEDDRTFRKQLIHGYVHDPGAAMLGGVGGHAGLFGNANDLAKLMQLYVENGSYGGVRYINDTIVKEYTSCQYCENENRRGVGFDKPLIDNEDGGPTCTCVSYMSFGHSGFTGTYAWADPESKIVYIFLSNRIHPDVMNKKLISLSIRTRIQEVIHGAVSRIHEPELVMDSISE